jgi:ABC-type glycerol-3-phosphate transport system permease component
MKRALMRGMKPFVFTLAMILVALAFVFPFYAMIMMSTQVNEDLYKGIPLLPGKYLVENIKTVFAARFGIFYANSFIVATSATLLSVAVSTLTGYAFAMYRFRFSKQLFSFILVTMMVPLQLGLVAFVVEMKAIGWMNTFLPLIIPPAATGFGVYWMRNYIGSSLPIELLESGRLDGASELRILYRISLPCIRPAIFALLMMNFAANWNGFLVPLIVLNKPETYTIPIGIITLNSAYRTDLAARIAALTIGTIPLVAVFLASSKSFIQGLTMGAVKG